MAVFVRDFQLDDQRAVADLIQAGLRERWGAAFDPNRNDDLVDIAGTYVDRGASVLVGHVNDVLTATGTLLVDDGDGELVRMSVAATHRRLGLGRQMVEALLDRAGERGVRRVRVSTDTPWTSAVELYRSCGFIEIGTDETDTHFELRL